MPNAVCCSCNRLHRIPTDKWKLILDDEPYACSKECVRAWIEKTKNEVMIGIGQLMALGGKLQRKNVQFGFPAFRSEFEKRFATWLLQNKLLYGYEEWTFPVGTTVYIPDFYINEAAAFIETKGLWRLGQKKKFKKFRAQYPEIPILIVPWIIQGEFK